MEARLTRIALLAAVLLVSMGARHKSAIFVVETSDPGRAAEIAQTAETLRHDLALEWLGQVMPNWAQPCMMTVRVAPTLGAGGATTFVFDRGEVFGWRMTIQGSRERLLDSVLPHEITHMVFASYFRRPLPRWADEGGATSVEHASERTKHRTMLVQFLRTGRGIAFAQMFAMTEYPRDVMPLYAQSYALSEYLIQRGGRQKYVQFMADGVKNGQWTEAVRRHYGLSDLGVLQNAWVAWVAQGFPEVKPSATALAAASIPATETSASPSASPGGEPRRPRPEPNLIYRTRQEPIAGGPGRPVAAAPVNAAPPAGVVAATGPVPSRAEAVVLPASGWRTAGAQPLAAGGTVGRPYPNEPAFASSPAAGTTAVTRPPAMEPSQQIILEWRQP
jgi:hypothetical protein